MQFQTGVGRPTWFLLQAKMLSNTFFLWLVDYAPEGSMFLISKCDFSPLFQAERSLLRHNKAFRFFNFLQGRKGERLNLDLPLVANVEPLIEADITASELRHTDFDFLYAGLALTGMYIKRVHLPLLIRVLVIDVKIFVIFTALVTPNFGALIFCTVAEL